MASPVIVPIEARDLTRAGVQSAQRNFQRLGQVSDRAFGLAAKTALGLTTAVGGLAVGTALLTKRQAALTKELKLVSDTTGVGIRNTSAWTEEFKRFGLEAEDVRDVLNELNIKQGDALDGTQSVIDAYAVFGLSLQEIKDMNAHEQLLAIADGFAQVENHAQAAWAADAIFGGDMAQRTIPILMQGREALEANASAYAAMGLIIDEQAVAAAQRYDEAQVKLNQQLEGFGRILGTAVMPHLTNVLTGLNALLQLGRQLIPLTGKMLDGTLTFAQGFSQAFDKLPPQVQTTVATMALNFAGGLNNMLQAVWEFGFQMSSGIAKAVNDVIANIEQLTGVSLGRAGVTFRGDAPTITVGAEIIAAANRVIEDTVSRTIPGGGGQTYTAVAGDTPSGIAERTGLTLAQVRAQNPGGDYGLQIGQQFRYGPGGERTIELNRYRRDPGALAALSLYEQSLIQPDRSTPEAQAAAAEEGQDTIRDVLNWAQDNPVGAILGATVGLGGARATWRGLNFATMGVPRAALRAAPGAVSGGFRLGGAVASLYNNRLTRAAVSRATPSLARAFVNRAPRLASGAASRAPHLLRAGRAGLGLASRFINPVATLVGLGLDAGRVGDVTQFAGRSGYGFDDFINPETHPEEYAAAWWNFAQRPGSRPFAPARFGGGLPTAQGLPPVNIINIQVDDTETFIERLNEVIETGAIASLTDAYESERRGGE